VPHACLTDKLIANLTLPRKGQVTYWDALKGFGCRVSYGGSKTFIVMHGPRGRRRRTVIGTYPRISLSEARSTARQILAQIILGQYKAKSTTFAVALEKYLIQKATETRYRTSRKRERVLRRHFLPVLGRMPLSDITPLDIAEITDGLVYAPTMARSALVFAKAMLRWCVRRGYIQHSPCEPLQIPRSPSRSRVLSEVELVEILRACLEAPGAFSSIVLLLITTGQRRTEIGSLAWSMIDEHQRLIALPPTLTKNKRGQILPYGELTANFLAGVPKTDTLLFRGRRHDAPLTGWSNHKNSLDTRCAISPWRLHDLRRTFATIHASIGTPLHIIERLLNHVTGQISGVAAIYNRHRYISEMREAVRQYESYIGGLIEHTASGEQQPTKLRIKIDRSLERADALAPRGSM
jgi:integrase